jgi:hypothetical protein
MKTKKAILIDVANRTVTETTIGNYTDIYHAIGDGCRCFTVPVEFENLDALYVDDEGLLNDTPKGCFMMKGWDYPIVGNGVILGTDEEGESIDHKSDIDEIRSQVKFGDMHMAEVWRAHALSTPPTIYPLD